MTSVKTPLIWIVLGLMVIPGPHCIPNTTPDNTLPDTPPTDEQEPNGSLEKATIVQWDALGRALLRGRIYIGPEGEEADYFALGPLQAGDRLILEVRTQTGGFDTILAVFDASGKLFALNDNDPTRTGSLDPSINQIIRHGADAYYAVITQAAFGQRVEGDYEIFVSLEHGETVPSLQSQVVLLDFNAAQITIPAVGQISIDSFNAGDIDARYAGETTAIKQRIVATCRQNFARFNVLILDSDHDLPPDGPYSRVYFGGYDPHGLGMALAGTDSYNTDPRDEAIVFTQRFTPDLFTHPPDAQQLGTAIGNITAHEIGHLLGLYHVRDNLALMNTYDAPDYLLLDQSFKNTIFDIHTFPIIDARLRQDAVLLLAETVGLVAPATNSEITVGTEPAALATGDWNDDGHADLAVADPTSTTLWLMGNDGRGSFTIDALALPERNPVFVVSGDFNGDGLADLATANFRSDSVSLLLNQGDGKFSPPIDSTAGAGPFVALTSDFDGDSLLDLAVLNMVTDEIAILVNRGNAGLDERIVIGRGTNLSALASGDFDSDGVPDLAYAHVGMVEELGGITILSNQGGLTFIATGETADSTLPVALLAADLNHDQAADLVLADLFTDTVAILLNDGGGNFAAPVFYPTGGYPCAIAAGDLDNDGHPDLAVANKETEDVSLLFNRGDGTFEPQWPYRIGSEPYALLVLDLDGDGDLDVVTANRSAGTVATLMNNGERSFGQRP